MTIMGWPKNLNWSRSVDVHVCVRVCILATAECRPADTSVIYCVQVKRCDDFGFGWQIRNNSCVNLFFVALSEVDFGFAAVDSNA